MRMTCDNCTQTYDDAECSTICPHHALMAPADLERKKAGIELVGKMVVFHHRPDMTPLRVCAVGWNGMVSLAGVDGEYSPNLLDVVPS